MHMNEVTPQEFATLIGCTDLVGGYCLNVTEHSGLKATYHDRSVTEWVAFSHVCPAAIPIISSPTRPWTGSTVSKTGATSYTKREPPDPARPFVSRWSGRGG